MAVKLKSQSDALKFVELQKKYLDKQLKDVRMDTVNEIGKLHPRSFNFVSQGIPVSWKILNTPKNSHSRRTQ